MQLNNKIYQITIGAAVAGALIIGWSTYSQSNDVNESDAVEISTVTPVNVVSIQPYSLKLWKNFSARLEAVDQVDLRPQVRGSIVEVRFEDGQYVNEGDVLFVIDPAPYRAAVNQAKAELDNAENEYKHSMIEFKRAKNLIATNAISQRIYDERLNQVNVAKALVEAAKARLQQANINFDRAYVKAPISGRTSRIEVTRGNLVEEGTNAPVLTSIVSDSAMYADFEVDEQTYVQYVRSQAKDRAAEKNVPVRLRLNGDNTTYEGSIYTFDNRLDPSTGTIRARALFKNSDNVLLPGMFAQVEMGSVTTDEKIVLDERAIGTDQDRKFVYVVVDSNTVEYREIKLGQKVDGKRVITSGLVIDDQVIIDGTLFIRPGMIVKPILIEQKHPQINDSKINS